MDLKDTVEFIRNYAGLKRKEPIGEVVRLLEDTRRYGKQLQSYGDDAAAIPMEDGYLLFAADGMMASLLLNEPYAAGKAAVMVTVNDIYSMGGRPLGLVNVLASGDPEQRRRIVEGIAKGCRKLRVPMLGGHLHPDAPPDRPALSVAILGRARRLLRSHLAAPGDFLVVAVDLEGRAGCRSVVSWDANSGKTPEELLYRLEALPLLAEKGWAKACKDISNAGLLGTAAIMMENSGTGAAIDLDRIPRPASVSFRDWLVCFQSFGFVLSVPPLHVDRVLGLFRERRVEARVIGEVRADSRVFLHKEGRTELLFDFRTDRITGISCRSDGLPRTE